MRARLCACAPCEPIEKNNYFSPLEATAETQTRREEEIGERERERERDKGSECERGDGSASEL